MKLLPQLLLGGDRDVVNDIEDLGLSPGLHKYPEPSDHYTGIAYGQAIFMSPNVDAVHPTMYI
jgi:hypothetical protein